MISSLEHNNWPFIVPNLLFPLSGQDYWYSWDLFLVYLVVVTQDHKGLREGNEVYLMISLAIAYALHKSALDSCLA